MANHCWNYAVFEGKEERLKQLISALEKTRKEFIEKERDQYDNCVWLYGLNTHKVLGTRPPKKNEGGSYDIDPYDKYGSKWFDCEWIVEKKEDKVTSVALQGSSAWSPMLPLFEKICKRMNLECWGNYEESGMDFAGEFTINPTGIYEHLQMSYREYQATHNPECFWEDIIINIEEGCFVSLEGVYEEFRNSGWELTEGEKEELKKVYYKHQTKDKENQ